MKWQYWPIVASGFVVSIEINFGLSEVKVPALSDVRLVSYSPLNYSY